LRCVAEVGYITKRQAFFNPKCFRLTRARAADNGFGRNSFTGWILPPVEPISNPVAAAFAATRQI
jgi:hypothetical protein